MTEYANGVLKAQEDAHEGWIDRARAKARELARAKGVVTSDDIWHHCPPPEGLEPRTMGAVFHPRRDWRAVGYVKSVRHTVNHGRPVQQWEYVGSR